MEELPEHPRSRTPSTPRATLGRNGIAEISVFVLSAPRAKGARHTTTTLQGDEGRASTSERPSTEHRHVVSPQSTRSRRVSDGVVNTCRVLPRPRPYASPSRTHEAKPHRSSTMMDLAVDSKADRDAKTTMKHQPSRTANKEHPKIDEGSLGLERPIQKKSSKMQLEAVPGGGSGGAGAFSSLETQDRGPPERGRRDEP
ncbi:MAG: hypothetical protein M1815_004959 [Lichina confinis]|nr:MAG: hypothetical protein M1815_004959 [Lichina confinis]